MAMINGSVVDNPGVAPLGFFLSLFIIVMVLCLYVSSDTLAQTESEQLSSKHHFFYPYSLSKREYNFDLGVMKEKKTLYWLGGELGLRVGDCLLLTSSSCQNYLDLLGGVGGADGVTLGMGLVSLRWQFSLSSLALSPSLRLFLGTIHLQDKERNNLAGTFGWGVASTVSLHPHLDLKVEVRSGWEPDQTPWLLFILSLGLKVEKWLDQK